MTSTIERRFLGWQQPLLASTVDWLAGQRRTAHEWNLKDMLLVVPGKRAGRRLLERLVLRAEQDAVWLTPPRILTLGELPELLYPLKRPLANDLVQQLTWAKALREINREVLTQLVPHPPDAADLLAWWALAMLLWSQHRELAAEGLDFADVIARGRDVPGFAEIARWEAMRQVQETYLRALDELGQWDVQTARLFALKHKEPQTSQTIVLVATVDMNQATRQMLDLVADRVVALIGAPPELADRFDSHGCLIPSAWNAATLEIPDEAIRVCDGPAEQAGQVIRELQRLDGRFRTDEIVIGLADARLAPYVEREMASQNLATRWIEGLEISTSGPLVFLEVVAELLEGHRFDQFAALVRHPDFQYLSQIRGEPGFDIAALDELFQRHLPISPDVLQALLEEPLADVDSMLRPRPRAKRRSKGQQPASLSLFSESSEQNAGPSVSSVDDIDRDVLRMLAAVNEILIPLNAPDRPLPEWSEPLRTWLNGVYGQRTVDPTNTEGRVLLTALRRLREVIEELASIPLAIAPVVNVAEAIRCVLKRAAGECVPPDSSPAAIEMLGWLELPLDDTPVAIVTTLNEGFVPTSLNSDLFLPNELRRRLGLYDNDRRYARDAYAMSVLHHSRQDVVWLVGQRDEQGNPLFPSRLLMAVDSEKLPSRVLRFLESSETAPFEQVMVDTATNQPATPPFEVPHPRQIVTQIGQPQLLEPVREVTLKATEFKSYLACPYRYFLANVLKLSSSNDHDLEMNALTFGSVLHEVLRRFGKSEAKDSADEETLRRKLLALLDVVKREQFGNRRRAAVNVQLAQIESRLEAFARRQAEWRREGWKIEFIERSVSPDGSHAPHLKSRSVSLWLSGRIDRIDRNEHTGRWAVLDYKSGDRGESPRETHLKKSGWVDLQLPMYRHLAKTLELPEPIELGYINLPRDLNATGFRLAEWSREELDDADQAALAVAEQIAQRIFWPRNLEAHSRFDEFASICQEGVFGSAPSAMELE